MHLNLNSNMRSNFNTNGRTDERYEDGQDVDLNLTAVDTGARIGDSAARGVSKADAALMARLLNERTARHSNDGGKTIAQILDAWLDRMGDTAGRRWPVVRTGERAPIPWPLRASIYDRDSRTCKTCGWYGAEGHLELDHCIPWSAGGPDDSDNLRTLCSSCNQRRSNYIDTAHLTNLRPTTYWCVDCWTHENQARRFPWRDGTDLTGAPLVGEDYLPTELVYCAHCHYFSTSDVYFVGDRGRDLLERATLLVREVEQ